MDVAFVGAVDQDYLQELVRKAEGLIKRKIRFLVYPPAAFEVGQLEESGASKPFLLWSKYQNVKQYV